MPDEVEGTDVAVEDDSLSDEVEETPIGFVIWGRIIHTVLASVYFLLISFIAIAIDLGLHWFDALPFVEKYGLSRIIKWEVELMAYSLATVDTFLFMRVLIQPGIEWLVRYFRRGD